jgi:hypothetical protein
MHSSSDHTFCWAVAPWGKIKTDAKIKGRIFFIAVLVNINKGYFDILITDPDFPVMLHSPCLHLESGFLI